MPVLLRSLAPRLTALLLITLATPAIAETWRAEAEAAAGEVFRRNLSAIEARDAEAYLACYLPDEHLVRNGFGGVALGYEELAASVGEGWPDVFEARQLQVFALTPDTAYGQYRYRVAYGDDVQEGISERVFVRTDDGWRIAVTTAFGAPDGALPALDDEATENR